MFRMLLSAWADRASATDGPASAPPPWLLKLAAGAADAGADSGAAMGQSGAAGALQGSGAAAQAVPAALDVIDLHGLSTAEARAVVLCALRECRDRATMFSAAAAAAAEGAWAAGAAAEHSRGLPGAADARGTGAGAAAAAAAAAADALAAGLTVITGRGANSQNGVAVIRQEACFRTAPSLFSLTECRHASPTHITEATYDVLSRVLSPSST